MGAGPPAYQVTKAALNVLTRTLAGELMQLVQEGRLNLDKPVAAREAKRQDEG